MIAMKKPPAKNLGLLQVLGVGDVMAKPTTLAVSKKFDPCLDLEPVSEGRLVVAKKKSLIPFRQFSYHLGHDKYGRAFVRNLLNGEWIMYDESVGNWVTSLGPDNTPPPK